jgi:thioredoxin 1
MGTLLELTDANFDQEVLKSDVPVLVDFWAVWCGPCKMVAPIMEEIAKEYEGKIKVGKVDVDNNRQTATNYSIRSIPTIILYKNGEVAEVMVGAAPKTQIISKISTHL